MTETPITASGYELVVGLEVHCELATATKLFCGCPNAFGSEPNTNICPVCLGLPGSLPVLNAHAVELAARIGLALGCEVRDSIFHRKNYFYPDMPKDYQVSQYDEPINVDGELVLADGSRVGIVRAHIEEDTGKTTHLGGGGRISDSTHSLVDYNRAGVPLVEIVSAPDLYSAEQARAYVGELRALLVATGASDGRMEEGSLRVDANVSVRLIGAETLGTRCEIKNLNSLRSLGRAIDYEATRQVELVSSGGAVIQQTRHWNEDEGRTSALRSKEEAYDYRYFPEPDLVPVRVDEALLAAARPAAGSLPSERRAQLVALFADGESPSAEQVATVVELGLEGLVAAATAAGVPARLALARATNEAAQNPEAARRLAPESFAKLYVLEAAGTVTATQSKAVLAEMLGGDPSAPAAIAARLGFEALGDDALESVVAEVVSAHPAEWDRFAAGDDKVAQFLLGQVMRRTSGRANGRAVGEVLAKDARRGKRVSHGERRRGT